MSIGQRKNFTRVGTNGQVSVRESRPLKRDHLLRDGMPERVEDIAAVITPIDTDVEADIGVRAIRADDNEMPAIAPNRVSLRREVGNAATNLRDRFGVNGDQVTEKEVILANNPFTFRIPRDDLSAKVLRLFLGRKESCAYLNGDACHLLRYAWAFASVEAS